MQEQKLPVPNASRSERTRTALKAAARKLFVEKGYAETGTSEIVKAAGVTRGALYHHYEDKRALFAEIVEDDCAAVAADIEAQGIAAGDAISALKAGSDAFIKAYAEAERTKIVLVEAPVVLGRELLIEIEDRHTRHTLVEGLRAAMQSRQIRDLPLSATVEILSAMFDAAAHQVESGMDHEKVRAVVHAVIDGLEIRRED